MRASVESGGGQQSRHRPEKVSLTTEIRRARGCLLRSNPVFQHADKASPSHLHATERFMRGTETAENLWEPGSSRRQPTNCVGYICDWLHGEESKDPTAPGRGHDRGSKASGVSALEVQRGRKRERGGSDVALSADFSSRGAYLL